MLLPLNENTTAQSTVSIMFIRLTRNALILSGGRGLRPGWLWARLALAEYTLARSGLQCSICMYSDNMLIDTGRITCTVCVTVRCPSVCLSVPSVIDRCSSVRRVCCRVPGGQETSIDCCMTGVQQQRRAVSRCQ